MATPEAARNRAAINYNAAADWYDDPANSFWDRFGRRTVERLALKRGARVLDVYCGSGASAIPAAERVGAEGFVLGVDLAENLLARARAKAERRGLTHTEFRAGDMLDLKREPDFDAVICVFGIFFVADMSGAVGELWQLVRPGGVLAITTWGPRFFEPASTIFWNAVRHVRPDLYKGQRRVCGREKGLTEQIHAVRGKMLRELGGLNVPGFRGSEVPRFRSPIGQRMPVQRSFSKGEQMAKSAKAKSRTVNAAFMKPMMPSAALSEVIGAKPMPRTEVTKRLWAYIKKNDLQDSKNRRMIKADARLKVVFGGKSTVNMFEMTKLVGKHLK